MPPVMPRQASIFSVFSLVWLVFYFNLGYQITTA
jgi:hypothetical protein